MAWKTFLMLLPVLKAFRPLCIKRKVLYVRSSMYELVNRAIYGLETQKTLTTQLQQFEFDLR
jgi:hypothetical protein